MTLSRQGARTLYSLSVCTLLAFASLSPAQQVAAGHASQVAALPVSANTVLVRKNGDFVWFDGNDLWLEPVGGAPSSLLHIGGTPLFGSFVIDADPGTLLFGESSTGLLWLVPLNGTGTPKKLGKLPFNYDAVWIAPGSVLVSAKPLGFTSPDNHVVHVALATGEKRVVAAVPGVSGPLAVAANGDVFYATASPLFPTPTGQVSILRFPRPKIDRAIATRARLSTSDAIVVRSGLDAASDLCVDDDGDLFFADWMNNSIGELNDATGPAPSLAPPLVAYGFAPGAASMHFAPAAPGGAVFEPFQPTGSTLYVHETDWFSVSQVRAIAPTRADLAVTTPQPVATGPCTLQVTGGPANAFGLVAIAIGPAAGPVTIVVPGFEQPLSWSLASATPVFLAVALDAAGAGAVVLTNPGFTPALVTTAQAALASPLGILAATTDVTFLLGT